MKERILFLDVDGVLNSLMSAYAFQKFGTCRKVENDYREGLMPEKSAFSNVAVATLKQLHSELPYNIVLSSTWRKQCSLEAFASFININHGWDIKDILIGKTGNSATNHRGAEINEWIQTNRKDQDIIYAILDDSSDILDEQLPYFVKTPFEDGFSWKNKQQLEAIFREEKYEANKDRLIIY